MKKIPALLTFIFFVALVVVGLGLWLNKKPDTTLPNIFIAIADDASFPHMSIYGSRLVNTPGFDEIANRGLLFTNAYTPNAKCAPSRAIFLTGRYSWQLEEAANHQCYFPAKYKSFFEILEQNGYETGYTGKGWAPGIALDSLGKKRDLTGHEYNDIKTTPPTEHISNIDYVANFKAFLKNKDNGKPFCFWYGALEPHRAYEYGSGMEKGGKSFQDIDRVYSFWPQTERVKNDMLDYAFEVEHFDQHLSEIIRFLEKEKMLENTIVIVTSDHGMPFPRVKGQAYPHSNHVPFSMMWLRGMKNPGRVIDDFVNFSDVAPTLLQLTGIPSIEKQMHIFGGKSFVDILESPKSGWIDENRDFAIVGKERHDVGRPNDVGYPIRGIITANYLYVKNFETERWPTGNPETGYLNCDGGATKTEILDFKRNGSAGDDLYWDLSFGKRPSEELYKLATDPDCMNNLAGHESYQEIKKRLEEKLYQKLREQNDPRLVSEGYIFDEYLIANEKMRNFYTKYLRGDSIEAVWVNKTDYEKPELTK